MRITSINRHKLDTNKNIFHVIEVGATMFTWTRSVSRNVCFVGENIEAAYEVAKNSNIVRLHL